MTTTTDVGRVRAWPWSPSAYAWAALLYVGLTLVYAWPLLPVLGARLAFDMGDPALNAWILWWNAQAIPLTERWWNAPMFFPAAGTFALSETLLSLTPLTTPLQWLGANPVVAYNVAFLASFPAAALGAHALAHRLTGRHDAALVAGLAFGFSPYRAAQLPHLQMLWSCWMPFCLVALHRYLEDRRTRFLALAGACWVLNGLTSGYYLMFFSVLLGLWMVWFARSWRQWLPIAGALAVASVAIAPVLVGYIQHQQALGVERSFGEINEFSADASAIWAAPRHVWLSHRWTLQPRSEGELYPGLVVLALALAGAFVAWRAAGRIRWSRWRLVVAVLGGYLVEVVLLTMMVGPWAFTIFGMRVSLTRPGKPLFLALCLLAIAWASDPRLRQAWRRRSAFLFYAVAAIAMFVFALGPSGYAFEQIFWPRAPYVWLMDLLPGGRALRVPARFAMLLMLCLSVCAALGFARLARGHRLAPALAAALAAAVALDGWVVRLPTAAAPAPLELSARALAAPAALLELPIRGTFSETAALLRATGHRIPTVNGFSGYSPRHYFAMREALAVRDPLVLDALRQFRPLVVVVHRDAEPAEALESLVRAQPDVEPLGDTDLGPAFWLSERARPAAEGVPVPIVGVTADVNRHLVPLMTDGDLQTGWLSGQQAAGTALEVDLGATRSLQRVDLDLGPRTYDFPRDLEVAIGRNDEPPAVVWAGDTAGLAALGILTDPRRATVTIPLPDSAVGDRLILTLRSAHGSQQWSVAELRVFARAASHPMTR